MRKHNEEKSNSRMEAEGKQREAESFRQSADARVSEHAKLRNEELK
jgi:hypothetical protein